MYIIAEIGINHNGNIDMALQMMREAKLAGAHCVKFQKRDPDICVPEEQKNQPREWCGQRMTYLEYKKAIEFGQEEYDKIAAFAKEIDIDWTASVWDLNSLKFMEQYHNDIPFIKVPSACITNHGLLYAIKESGMLAIISGGMSTGSMIEEAITILGSSFYGLLHCNSTYPSQENELDLQVIKTYRHKFEYEDVLIGYSSHDTSNLPCIVAAALGARVIERHITLDKTLPGTDQKASADISEFRALCQDIARIPQMLGHAYPTFYKSEQLIAEKLRRYK